MKVGVAQINPTVGDLSGNTRKIIDFIAKARKANADLVVFPELAITGYPPEDLVLKPQFITDNLACLKKIISCTKDIGVYLGFVDRVKKDLFNAGAFIVNGKLVSVYHKIHLPNYAVFDEKRYFQAGSKPLLVKFKGQKIGLGICEDIWAEPGPYAHQARQGAKIILNINASPYEVGRVGVRARILKERAKKYKVSIIYVNQTGGQDELVFDGGSMVIAPAGKLMAKALQYQEELLMVDLAAPKQAVKPWLSAEEEIYQALLLGIKDYVRKNGFSEVVIGLSGGIDSALTLSLAADALGKDQVHALFMPSKFTTEQSFNDAKKVAANFGVGLINIPIKDIHRSYLKTLTPHFRGKKIDITEENIQARIRGNTLMALSNKFGWLVLTTGNKSEMSVGYCTLYGDMAGGFGVLKDIPKTLVYRLAKYRNQSSLVIPESIIRRPPTAELKLDQEDQDTLPPYETLDPIMKAYVEENKSLKQIKALGFAAGTVKRVISMIDRSEYKRRQAPPGPRISPRAFGKDWRVPITNKVKGGD